MSTDYSNNEPEVLLVDHVFRICGFRLQKSFGLDFCLTIHFDNTIDLKSIQELAK